jgi:phospholipase/carboxylesterase
MIRMVALLVGVTTKLGIVLLFIASSVAVFLLLDARTVEGRLFAMGILSLLVTSMYLCRCLATRGPPSRVQPIAISLTVSTILLLVCVLRSPSGQPSPGSPLKSLFLDQSRYCRLSPTVLVPEADQVRLGSYVLPILDPVMDSRQAGRFRQVFDSLYSEIRDSDHYVSIGSVLGDAYSDMFLRRRHPGHLYVYYPTNTASERQPALIFLHGWLGNFKAYVWLWSKFAERNGFVVVCPSFGGGFWNHSDGVDTLKRTLEFCVADGRIDPSRIYVAGLSNGGMAVTRCVLHFPELIRGVIYVSPVLEGDLLSSKEYIENIAGKRVLVVYGGKDRRLPPDYVSAGIELLETLGVDVESRRYEEEEHILIFSAFDRLMNDVEAWLKDETSNRGVE